MKREEIREALKRDFRKLYVKEFTTNWETLRLIREVEIDVMSLDNLYALLSKPQQPEQEVVNPDDGKKKTVRVMSLCHDATLQNLISDSLMPSHGTGKVPKADPDREKLRLDIVKAIVDNAGVLLPLPSPHKIATKIIALFNPDEIRRQERERIISRIEPYQIKLERKDVVPMVYFRLTKEDWQSL